MTDRLKSFVWWFCSDCHGRFARPDLDYARLIADQARAESLPLGLCTDCQTFARATLRENPWTVGEVIPAAHLRQ